MDIVEFEIISYVHHPISDHTLTPKKSCFEEIKKA